MRQQTSIMSAATLIGSLSFVSAFLGIIKNRFFETIFIGADKQLIDAFLAAFRVPDFLFQLLVVGVLSATFIPVYTRVMQDKRQADILVSTLLTLLASVYCIVAVLAGIFAVPIIATFTGDHFTAHQIALSASLMRVMLVAQFFFLISNVLSGILQSNKNFILPALSPILYNIGIIVGTIFLHPMLGIYGPAVGVLLGAFAHLLVQLPLAFRYGFKPRLGLDLRNTNVREVMRLMIPRGATLSTNALEDFFQVYIATSFGATLIRIVNYSSALTAAPVRFFGVAIAQAALPFLSSEAREKDAEGFSTLLVKTLHQIAFFMLPAGALLLVLRIPIVRLAYGAKGLPWPDTVLLGRMVALFSISVGASAMIHVVLRAYYALKETRIPFFVAAIAMCINILLMWVGAYNLNLQILAIPTAFTVAAIVELFLLLFFLFGRLHVFSWKEFFLPQAKLVIAAFCMAVSLYIPMKILDQLVFDTTRTLGLLALTGIASTIGMLVYLLFCKILAVEQLSIVTSIQGRVITLQKRLGLTTEVLQVADETFET